ncbi:hypothetical protein F5884DRAFT_406397 [Xylogone sp. PMI_703]|nr:hypothetical protein F5884DRAFT_406397 [Xylogone sp. PMI_703]
MSNPIISNGGNNANKVQHKIRTSCDACQDAKVRCGREKPTCRRCENQERTCIYSHARPLGRPRKVNSTSSVASATNTTTMDAHRHFTSLPEHRVASEQATPIASDMNRNAGHAHSTRPRSTSRESDNVNNDNSIEISINNDWLDISPLPSAESRTPIDILLPDSDNIGQSSMFGEQSHNIGIDPMILENADMDISLPARLSGSLQESSTSTDYHLLPPLEDKPEESQQQHYQTTGGSASDQMTTSTTDWVLGLKFDQRLSSASSSLNPGMEFTHSGGPRENLSDSHFLFGSHLNSSSAGERGSYTEHFNLRHPLSTLGSKSPNTSTVLRSTSSRGSSGPQGQGVLLLSRQRMQCTCCDSILQTLVDLDMHLSGRSAISLDSIMKFEKETRIQTLTILKCDSCSQKFRPRILLLMGVVLEAVVELLEGVLNQTQQLSASATSISSSSKLASPPASIFEDNTTSSTPGETVNSCSLWLGDYEISGQEKTQFLKHLVTTRLHDIADTVHQLCESVEQYCNRPAFKVGTSMLVEVYRHIQAIVKSLKQ